MKKPEEYYDEIAKNYDGLFQDRRSLVENKLVSKLIGNINGNVLDIGCGTGLFLELPGVNMSNIKYVGIDPSKEMCNVLERKHPYLKGHILCTTLEDMPLQLQSFDHIISLFGSISYVDMLHLRFDFVSQLNCKGLFLMFYAEGYSPVTYERAGVKERISHNEYTIPQLEEIFDGVYPKVSVLRIQNYNVVTNLI